MLQFCALHLGHMVSRYESTGVSSTPTALLATALELSLWTVLSLQLFHVAFF